jgi:hypothetical protein
LSVVLCQTQRNAIANEPKTFDDVISFLKADLSKKENVKLLSSKVGDIKFARRIAQFVANDDFDKSLRTKALTYLPMLTKEYRKLKSELIKITLVEDMRAQKMAFSLLANMESATLGEYVELFRSGVKKGNERVIAGGLLANNDDAFVQRVMLNIKTSSRIDIVDREKIVNAINDPKLAKLVSGFRKNRLSR